MELEFTTDQDELRDSIRAVLGKESPVSLARARRRATTSGPTALWATMVELGWPALDRSPRRTAASGSACSSRRSSPRSSAG